MRVLYHLAYPDKGTRNEVYLIEKFIAALNNREVQNHVRRRKPATYAESSEYRQRGDFICSDGHRHTCPGWTTGPYPGR